MGGQGSGNHYYHWWRPRKKTTVEQCRHLDANRWMQEGVLGEGVCRDGWWTWKYADGRENSISYGVDTNDKSYPFVRLWYSWTNPHTDEKEPIDYQVELTTTCPRFGGLRWWFLCPLVVGGRPCKRRVGKLYLPPGSRYFGCRHCHDLSYTSRQESRRFDSLYRHLAQSTGYDLDTVKLAMKQIGKRR